MRLIDADALIKRLEDTSKMPIPEWLRMEIINAPTTQITTESAVDYLYKIGWMQEHDRTLSEVEERTGRWCFNTDGKLVCSNCYETPTNRILLYADMIFDMTPVQEKMKFCPNCGARMEGR